MYVRVGDFPISRPDYVGSTDDQSCTWGEEMNFVYLTTLQLALGVYIWFVLTPHSDTWINFGMLCLLATIWTHCFDRLIKVLKEKS